jgi:hypothetical protein
MANRFGIPRQVEAAIRVRDRACVYCNCEMHLAGVAQGKASIEHLNHLPPFYWNEGLEADGIAICCISCNSSRGRRTHAQWFKSKYCVERNINHDTVSAPVKEYLANE